MYVLLPVCFVGETYASPLPLAFLRYSYGGCCSNLRSADVSRVDTVAFVNRLILNVITTLAIELSSYYEHQQRIDVYTACQLPITTNLVNVCALPDSCAAGYPLPTVYKILARWLYSERWGQAARV